MNPGSATPGTLASASDTAAGETIEASLVERRGEHVSGGAHAVRLSTSGAYVWRAAIAAALVNLLLNPGVALVTNLGRDFLPVQRVALYVAAISALVSILVSVLGARRVRREVESRHRVPSGGTTWERQLIERLPSQPALFGAALGLASTVAVLVVFTVVTALGFSGFSIATFSIVVSAYTGALAFVVMRWTILRQLMELVPVR